MDTTPMRTRGDLCPGLFRPWAAEDGLLVRLRLVGGRLCGAQLESVLAISERFGDGAVHLTARANLQVRGLPGRTCLPDEVAAAFESTGLVPSRSHELVRNILVSPQSGYAGGRTDLRPIAAELDRLLVADPRLGGLPGRFLFVLDDGRGDLVSTPADLGLVALDAERAQVRIGDGWGQVVPVGEAASALVELAREFLAARGSGPGAAWHVRELQHAESDVGSSGRSEGSAIFGTFARAREVPPPADPVGYGRIPGGVHVHVADGVLHRDAAGVLLNEPTLIVTPWRGIFIPDIRPAREQS